MMRATVDQIDAETDRFERLPDRPDSSFLRPRRRLTVDEARALQRMRTAAWRQANDRRGRPTSDQIARAILVAVCRSPDFSEMMQAELSVVRVAVNGMVDRGFVLSEIQDAMRSIRRRFNGQDRTAAP